MAKKVTGDWRKLTIHPFANRFRMMTDLEFEALKEDIRENGVQEQILLFRGQILDGRNRFRACMELDKEGTLPGGNPPFEEFAGSEQEAGRHVTSLNLLRRHLTKSEKAMTLVLDGLVSLPPKDGARREQGTGRDAIMEVGRRYGVNHMTLYKAAYIAAHDQDLAKKVANGECSVPVAETVIRDRLAAESIHTAMKGEQGVRSIERAKAALEDIELFEDALRRAKVQQKKLSKASIINRQQASEIQEAINRIWELLKHVKPSTVCRACNGAGCGKCLKRGWLPVRG